MNKDGSKSLNGKKEKKMIKYINYHIESKAKKTCRVDVEKIPFLHL